ncbi:uncharacterized protein LOC126791587 isoform X2 [Argentina anserina]|uniref:uncharacterized protein LOC126791587 isoform X2 n=1 Tax=Argentina anserina TaxID=57926 RepID=UPI0021767984|nr:uncharacterized protein LOC126791587 isoform X2 [Potentilla anserina]
MSRNIAEELSEDEKKALRGSKFAPLPSLPPPRSQPRLAHPGGPLTTNKAAALAKFLERKLQDPNGLDSINPQLVEKAVQNAKRTVFASAASNSQGRIRHVSSFGESVDEDPLEQEEGNVGNCETKKKKKNRKKKKNKQKVMEGGGGAVVVKPKNKKLKL